MAQQAVSLVTNDGLTRAMVIGFPAVADADDAAHWTLLCKVANALQAELGFPAPAVSVSGTDGYSLWLSLETPAPTAQVQAFLEVLRLAYFPSIELRPDAASAAIALPPCLNPGTGKWAAFIHPGLGASFANDPGLEMAPPFSGVLELRPAEGRPAPGGRDTGRHRASSAREKYRADLPPSDPSAEEFSFLPAVSSIRIV